MLEVRPDSPKPTAFIIRPSAVGKRRYGWRPVGEAESKNRRGSGRGEEAVRPAAPSGGEPPAKRPPAARLAGEDPPSGRPAETGRLLDADPESRGPAKTSRCKTGDHPDQDPFAEDGLSPAGRWIHLAPPRSPAGPATGDARGCRRAEARPAGPGKRRPQAASRRRQDSDPAGSVEAGFSRTASARRRLGLASPRPPAGSAAGDARARRRAEARPAGPGARPSPETARRRQGPDPAAPVETSA